MCTPARPARLTCNYLGLRWIKSRSTKPWFERVISRCYVTRHLAQDSRCCHTYQVRLLKVRGVKKRLTVVCSDSIFFYAHRAILKRSSSSTAVDFTAPSHLQLPSSFFPTPISISTFLTGLTWSRSPDVSVNDRHTSPGAETGSLPIRNEKMEPERCNVERLEHITVEHTSTVFEIMLRIMYGM